MRELKVTPIRNGTVIDHLPAGSALGICQVLGIPRPGSASTVSVVMNVPSDALGQKDIIKVEDRDLHEDDVAKLAILAPEATLNTIRDYQVAEKKTPEAPEAVEGLMDCPNPACITNDSEPVNTEFEVHRNGEGYELTCAFCVERVRDPIALLG